MTYMLLDKEEFLGDFASGGGIEEMVAQTKFPKLREFVIAGKADTAEELEAIADEVRDDSAFGYIAEMLDKAQPPVILSDGVADVPEDMDLKED